MEVGRVSRRKMKRSLRAEQILEIKDVRSGTMIHTLKVMRLLFDDQR